MRWRVVLNGLLCTTSHRRETCFLGGSRSSHHIVGGGVIGGGVKGKKSNYDVVSTTPDNVMAQKIQLVGNQKLYNQYLQDDSLPLVICTGPAGTGKTMLACKEAIRRLEDPRMSTERIIITRPTVMADDELGFLPGEIESKMQPWTRPLFDYLYEFSSRVKVQGWLKNGEIEILPLGYMRGRTFKRCFIIGDECQNIQISSMKMLLTRIGEDSKMVVVGDLDQSDLVHRSKNIPNGLQDFIERIIKSNITEGEIDPMIQHGIARVHLPAECVRRHPIISHILDIYAAD